MFFHVNNIIIIHYPNNQDTYDIFTKKLNNRFKLTKGEPFSIFLNICFIRDKKNRLY